MDQKLWIFGDSYGYRDYPNPDGIFTWPVALEQKYDVTNHCLWGTSVDYSIKKMIDEIDAVPDNDFEKVMSNTIVIFLLTYEFRFNFKFFEPQDQWIALYLINGEPAINKEKYTQYASFVNDFFDHYIDDYYHQKTEYVKHVGFLNSYAQLFKKMLVIPCFSPPHIRLANRQDVSLTFLNNEKFHLVNGGFCQEPAQTPITTLDPLPNHLPEEKHIQIYNEIIQWIDNEKSFDPGIL